LRRRVPMTKPGVDARREYRRDLPLQQLTPRIEASVALLKETKIQISPILVEAPYQSLDGSLADCE
jgi:hypothetical protein